MSEPVKNLVCRPVHGFSLCAVWSDTTPPQFVRYELALPGGAILPFRRDSLGAALKTFHACTDVWFWFAPPYRLHPIFKDETSDEVQRYVILGPDGQLFESSGTSDGLIDALSEFKRIAGVDLLADDVSQAASDPGFR